MLHAALLQDIIISPNKKFRILQFLLRAYTRMEATNDEDIIVDEGSLPAWGKAMSLTKRFRLLLLQDEARQLMEVLTTGGEAFSRSTFAKLYGALGWKRVVGPAEKKFRMSETFLALWGSLHVEDLQLYFGTEKEPKQDALGLGPRLYFVHD